MNLEEFREALASDATKKTDSLERQIEKFRREIIGLNIQISNHENDLRILYNRCFATNRGLVCQLCGMKEKCARMRSVGKSAKKEKCV